jgi:hypothetical protein
MTRDECTQRAQDWVRRAETGHVSLAKLQLGQMANAAAASTLAASIAQVWATLAVTAES